MNRFRACTYNIRDGAFDGRAERLLDVLAYLCPDLLVLTEAMGPRWERDGDLRRAFEVRLGMWSVGTLEPGCGDGAGRFTILFGRAGRLHPGRYKPLRTRTANWRGTGMQEFTVDGYPHVVTGMGIHGHTLDPETRLSEARHTARCSIDLTPGPAFMMGDRNSVFGTPAGAPWAHLPAEDIEPDWSRLPAGLLPYHLLLDEYGDPVLDAEGRMRCDRRPSKVLAVAGFRDPVARLLEPDARPSTGGFGPDDAERRLDGIYARGLTAIACDTLDSPDLADLSDHRLVHADYDLDGSLPS